MGRAAQIARLDLLVDEFTSGGTDALVVDGDVGIGKTALLTVLRSRAEAAGALVLTASGVQSEGRLAFVGLHDLLGPLLDRRSILPGEQARALASALALAPPRPGDRLAVCAATLGLVAHTARRQPVLVVVDDLPWLDAPSQDSVLFVARRGGAGMGVVLGARTTDLPPGTRTLPRMTVPPLTERSARTLLAEVAPDLAPATVDEVMAVAAGNPLALRELPGALDREQRTGQVELPVPLLPGRHLGAAYRSRLTGLGPDGRAALLVAATHDGDDVRTVAGACAVVGVDAGALVAAEDADLVRIADGRFDFVHPLVRGTVYHDSTADQRRTVHAALADVSVGSRRAWHLGASTIVPDEVVAAELEAAGMDALVRRGPASATVSLERAARLSPDRAACNARLLAAGEAAAAAGLAGRAIALARETARSAIDPVMRATAAHVEGLVCSRTSLPEAVAVLESEGRRVVAHDPVRGAVMLADAAMLVGAGTDLRGSQVLADEAAAVLTDDMPDEARAQVLGVHGLILHWRGQGPRARPIVEEAVHLAEGIDPLTPTGQSLSLILNVHLWSADFEGVRARSLDALERARELGALSAIPLQLLLIADTSWRLGDWGVADEAIAECLQVGEASGQPVHVDHLRAVRAYLAAVRGDERQVREDVDAMVAGVDETGLSGNAAFGLAALGLLAVGRQRVDEAIQHLEELDVFNLRSGLEEPTLMLYESDLVEMYVRAGRHDDARLVLDRLGRRAEASGSPVARACHARARGVVEGDYDQHFDDALAADDARPLPFERARTMLAWGRRLHRDRRRADARSLLHQAVASFERLGATPWRDQAVAELHAAGGRRSAASRRSSGESEQLTRHEERVARTVARGLTNAEAAAELFLSPKTIEFHLSRIYRKLDIRSRTQLAAVLLERDRAGGGPVRRP